jgi:hypothetical protein
LLGYSARWSADRFSTSTSKDLAATRTPDFFLFLQGVILAATSREVVFGSVILANVREIRTKDAPGYLVAAVVQALFWIGFNNIAMHQEAARSCEIIDAMDS